VTCVLRIAGIEQLVEFRRIGLIIACLDEIAFALIQPYDRTILFAADPDQVNVAIAVNVAGNYFAAVGTVRREAELLTAQISKPNSYAFLEAIRFKAYAVGNEICVQVISSRRTDRRICYLWLGFVITL
jgi:hypothetical protein